MISGGGLVDGLTDRCCEIPSARSEERISQEMKQCDRIGYDRTGQDMMRLVGE